MTKWTARRHAVFIASERITDEPWREIDDGTLLRIERTPTPRIVAPMRTAASASPERRTPSLRARVAERGDLDGDVLRRERPRRVLACRDPHGDVGQAADRAAVAADEVRMRRDVVALAALQLEAPHVVAEIGARRRCRPR